MINITDYYLIHKAEPLVRSYDYIGLFWDLLYMAKKAGLVRFTNIPKPTGNPHESLQTIAKSNELCLYASLLTKLISIETNDPHDRHYTYSDEDVSKRIKEIESKLNGCQSDEEARRLGILELTVNWKGEVVASYPKVCQRLITEIDSYIIFDIVEKMSYFGGSYNTESKLRKTETGKEIMKEFKALAKPFEIDKTKYSLPVTLDHFTDWHRTKAMQAV